MASKHLLCGGDERYISEIASDGYRGYRAVEAFEARVLQAMETKT